MGFLSVVGNFVFNIYNPRGIKLLTMLRVGLSHLREHKYQHNFRDTLNPFCPCDGKSIEPVNHFFLRCPNYTLHRVVLFENLNQIEDNMIFSSDSTDTQILLYGKNTYSDQINRRIIESTIMFLMNSIRFNEPLFNSN